MMELDEFGALFNAQFEQAQPEKSEEELRKQLQRRSRTALEKIMQNLLLEVMCGLIAILGMTVLVNKLDSFTMRWLSGLVWVVSIGQIVAFLWQYHQLKTNIRPIVTDLRTHLHQQIQIVERFIRMYYTFCLLAVPISFVLGGYIGVTAATQPINDPVLKPLDSLPLTLPVLAGLIGLAIAVLIGFLYLVKIYIQWLYGRHLDRLKACLTELKNE